MPVRVPGKYEQQLLDYTLRLPARIAKLAGASENDIAAVGDAIDRLQQIPGTQALMPVFVARMLAKQGLGQRASALLAKAESVINKRGALLGAVHDAVHSINLTGDTTKVTRSVRNAAETFFDKKAPGPLARGGSYAIAVPQRWDNSRVYNRPLDSAVGGQYYLEEQVNLQQANPLIPMTSGNIGPELFKRFFGDKAAQNVWSHMFVKKGISNPGKPDFPERVVDIDNIKKIGKQYGLNRHEINAILEHNAVKFKDNFEITSLLMDKIAAKRAKKEGFLSVIIPPKQGMSEIQFLQ